MSFNKIIIGFIIILLIIGGYFVYQLSKNPVPKSKVTIDSHTFSVDVATSSAQQQQGLSGKASFPKDQGMLFVFKTPARYPFWMKGMKFPIDIVFINNNKIVSISQNLPAPKSTTNDNELPVYRPTQPADKALEINSGLAKTYGFKEGDTVTVKLSK